MRVRAPEIVRGLITTTVVLASMPLPLRSQEPGPVEAQMRRVDFRLDPTVVLQIGFLRGRLLPAEPRAAPWFDDKRSFVIELDSAEVTVSTRTLSDLLNRHVFGYRGAPLRGLKVSIEWDEDDDRANGANGANGARVIVMKGRLYGIPFRTANTVELTSGGQLLLRPTSIRALGIPVGGLLDLVGLSLEKLVDWSKPPGIRARGNDLILEPTELLPAPRVRGRLVGFRLGDSTLAQVFRPARPGQPVPPPLAIPDSAAVNYMYYRGNTLRFGRLTMVPADLLIMDLHPADRFDFFLDRYRDQLAVGFSRTLPSGRLQAYMPDYRTVARHAARGSRKE
ncbi:MAG: hypothetical protein ACT4PM_00925 [Gemmatimonadales bacterium]